MRTVILAALLGNAVAIPAAREWADFHRALQTCADDANGILAANGYTCATALAAVKGDCGFDMGASGLPGLRPSGDFSIPLTGVCPVMCDACPAVAAAPTKTAVNPIEAAATQAIMPQLNTAHTLDADGTHHLFFRSLDGNSRNPRCGEVDAAPYMPAAIFEPRNILNLAAYAEATVRLYRTPLLDTPVSLGRCAAVGFDHGGTSGVQGITWAPNSILSPVCQERCGCRVGSCQVRCPRNADGSFNGALCDTPACAFPGCTDEPDDPDSGNFCSLCGPTTACPGCVQGTVSVNLWYPPAGPPPPPPPESCTASDIVCENGGFPSGFTRPGCSCRCARGFSGDNCETGPPALPNAGKELWFYFINTQAGPTLNGGRCGEVNAAPIVPPELFEPQNVLTLAAYVEATVRLYQVTFGRVQVTVQLGRCADQGFSCKGQPRGTLAQPGGLSCPAACLRGGCLGGQVEAQATANWIPNSIMTPTCEAACGCVWPYVGAFQSQPNGCDRIPGTPRDMRAGGTDAQGPFCTLCGSQACNIIRAGQDGRGRTTGQDGGCGISGINNQVLIDLWYRPVGGK